MDEFYPRDEMRATTTHGCITEHQLRGAPNNRIGEGTPKIVSGIVSIIWEEVPGQVASRPGTTRKRPSPKPSSAWLAWHPEPCGLAEGVNAGLSHLEKSYL